jgi:hypothetical protein
MTQGEINKAAHDWAKQSDKRYSLCILADDCTPNDCRISISSYGESLNALTVLCCAFEEHPKLLEFLRTAIECYDKAIRDEQE